MLFGAHVSAAGGHWKAPGYGAALGCEVIQFFSRPPQGWSAKPISDEDAEKFKLAMKEQGIQRAYVHAPYLINLASGNNRTRHGSISMLKDELARCSQLGVHAMMFHPGSAKEVGQEEGVKKVIEGLNKIMDGYEGSCRLLIEISAGAGAVMGDTFEELAAFIDGAERGKDIGICFDTQHAYASGYDLRTKAGVDDTFALFDKTIGLKKLVASHCNDSKVEFASHKDRHEHLGQGTMGQDAFKFIVQHPKLQHLDLILETPYEKEGEANDPRVADLELLKSFRS
ncbi:MAG: putative endonuclease 4 [Patescibacteria group bacterium]|jgi:deoxyribonuclease-4|nr:putative endonuclease 4 [Patescibacteria group bacterium]